MPHAVLAAVQTSAGAREAFRDACVGTMLATAAGLAEAAGVTRIADLTGLDRIGVPVVSAVRPNARSVTSASGKSLSFASACLSALMEALEQRQAEIASPDWCFAEIPGTIDPVDLASLPRALGAQPVHLLDPSKLTMSAARDIVSGTATAVPFDLVHCCFAPSWHCGGSGFLVSTNGLAGGATRTDAILHGLCEVIERDALALLHVRDPHHVMSSERTVDMESVGDLACGTLQSRCRAAGLQLSVFDITCDTAVPVYYARVHDRGAPRLGSTDGSGCHPVPEIALRRAVLEAIQTRALMISGARDEIRAHQYRTASQQVVTGAPTTVDEGAVRFAGTEAALDHVLSRLALGGFGKVLVVDLPEVHEALAFVRVIVPGMEGPIHSPLYAAGERAKRAATR